EPVLGMKMRQRQNEGTAAGKLVGAIEHLLAVDRAHAGVHHKRRSATENDADIRHQRHALVGDHVDAGGDLLQGCRIDIWSRRLGRGRRAARSITHGANLLLAGMQKRALLDILSLKRQDRSEKTEQDERLMSDALLALHFQNDICHPDGLIPFSLDRSTSAAAHFLSASKRALDEARRAGWIIAHIHIAFAPDYADLLRNCRLFLKTETLGALKHGSWGAAAFAGFEPAESEIVVTTN